MAAPHEDEHTQLLEFLQRFNKQSLDAILEQSNHSKTEDVKIQQHALESMRDQANHSITAQRDQANHSITAQRDQANHSITAQGEAIVAVINALPGQGCVEASAVQSAAPEQSAVPCDHLSQEPERIPESAPVTMPTAGPLP